MSVERNETLSGLVLDNLATNTAILAKAGEYRKSLVETQDADWSTIKAISDSNEAIEGIRQEIADTLAFAREFGIGDYEIATTVLQALPKEQRSACLASMLRDIELTSEQKFRLLTNKELNPQEIR